MKTTQPTTNEGSPQLLLARLALWLLIGINATTLFFSLLLGSATTKSEGILWASFMFRGPIVAPVIALLAWPALFSRSDLRWPRFVLALGLTPFPMMVLAQRIGHFLYNL